MICYIAHTYWEIVQISQLKEIYRCGNTCLTFYFDIMSNCKNNKINFCIPFTQIHQLLAFWLIALSCILSIYIHTVTFF